MLGAGSLALSRMAGFVRAGSSGPDFLGATSPLSASVSNDLFYLEEKKKGLCSTPRSFKIDLRLAF